MTSRKQEQQGQWNPSVAQKLEETKQRARTPWDPTGRVRKGSKRKYARVFTGCTY